jgi:hypothetical protein
MACFYVAQLRRLYFALLDRQRAARVKYTAGRRLRRAGRLAGQNETLALPL